MSVLYALALVVLAVIVVIIGVGVLGWQYLFGVIIPYVAGALFVLGLIYRIWKWARAPVPFHIPTTCGQQKSLPWIKNDKVESPTSIVGVVGRMALEILLFRSLFRNEKAELEDSKKLLFKGNRWLWLGGLVFHWSLFIIIFRHTRLFTEPVPSIVIFIRTVDGIFQQPYPILYLTDWAVVIALTYLFIRRVVYPQLRYISFPSDYFAVLLLLGIIIQGCLVQLFYKANIVAIKELAMGVLTFQPSVPEGINLAFYIHLFLVCVLIAYFPFSKLVHGAGILLSPTRILKNDSRMRRHVNPWDYPVRVHTYAEWEDEFREKMKQVGLPLEKE